MKTFSYLFAVAGLLTFASCGPSAEEQAKMEQMKKDSLAKVEAEKVRVADSIKAAMEAAAAAKVDSTMAPATETAPAH